MESGRIQTQMKRSREPESNLEKLKTTSNTKSEKPLIFLPKQQNQVLKNGKTATRNGHQKQKSDVCQCKTRKTDLQKVQKKKIENPDASPNLIQGFFFYFDHQNRAPLRVLGASSLSLRCSGPTGIV